MPSVGLFIINVDAACQSIVDFGDYYKLNFSE